MNPASRVLGTLWLGWREVDRRMAEAQWEVEVLAKPLQRRFMVAHNHEHECVSALGVARVTLDWADTAPQVATVQQ